MQFYALCHSQHIGKEPLAKKRTKIKEERPRKVFLGRAEYEIAVYQMQLLTASREGHEEHLSQRLKAREFKSPATVISGIQLLQHCFRGHKLSAKRRVLLATRVQTRNANRTRPNTSTIKYLQLSVAVFRARFIPQLPFYDFRRRSGETNE